MNNGSIASLSRAFQVTGILCGIVILLTQSISLAESKWHGAVSPSATHSPGAQSSTDISILSDGQFVYGPNVGDFDIATYLKTKPGRLIEYAGVFYQWDPWLSINPKVLLTIMEVQNKLVTDPAPSQQVLDHPVGYSQAGFASQIERLSGTLFDNFYSRLYDPLAGVQPPSVTFADGTRHYLPADINAGTYAIMAALAEVSLPGTWQLVVSRTSEPGFYQTYLRLFPGDDPLDESNTADLTETPPSDLLQFPFPVGESWYFNGAHTWDANPPSSSNPLSSLDFSRDWPACNTNFQDQLVVAAAGGTLQRPNPNADCWLWINHDGGWRTGYYHLTNVQKWSGNVNKNEQVANIGCETCAGGVWPPNTGAHVHFTLYHNGYLHSLDGVQLSGWTVHVGTSNYDSNTHITRGDQTIFAWHTVYNDGGGCTDTQNPDGDFTSPEDGSFVRESVNLAGWASDDCGVDYVEFTANYDGSWHSIYKDYSPPYEYTWNLSGIGDQTITLGYDIYDKAGHFAWSPHGTRQITKDATPPDGAYTSPADGTIVGNGVYLGGWASDNLSGVSYVNFTANYDGAWHVVNTDNTPPYEFTWDLSGIGDQTITLGFDIYDNADNYAWSPQGTRQIHKDTTGPAIDFYEHPTQNQWYNTDQVVRWRISDSPVGDWGFSQAWDSDPGGSSPQFPGATEGHLWLSWAGEGQHAAHVRAWDNLSNSSHSTSGWYGYDVTAPTGPSISVNGDAQYTNNRNVTLLLSASDALSGVSSMRLRNGGDSWGPWEGYATSRAWTMPPGDGVKWVDVQYRDAAGNESVGVGDSITLDTTRPDVTITSGPQGDIPVGDASFSWTGSDNLTPTASLVYSYRLRGLNDNWSDWFDTTSVSYTGLPDGNYTFEVKAKDLATNEDDTPASHSFFVDTTPPDTTIPSGPNGCIGTADATFTWTGSDNRTPTDQLQYSFWLEGYDAGWSAWSTTTSQTYSALPDGPYTFHVKAKDRVGHEDPSPVARSFLVDTTPPAGSVLINGVDSTTSQIAVRLDITGDDGPLGCGVTQMRLANDDHNYQSWRSFEQQIEWYLPPINRTTWTVHLQLKDLVGNVSGAFTDGIYLDFYPPRPASTSYQLGARVTAGGEGQRASESYRLAGATLGQALGGGRARSRWYRLDSGFQGAWPSVPRGRPAAEEYDVWDSVVAGSGDAPRSERYRLYGTGGQPVADGMRSSESYQLVSGFWLPAGWDLCGDDFDRDGVIGAGDIQRQIAHWRTSMGNRDPDRNPDTPNYEARYDRNLDGAINVVDVMRLTARWGRQCVVRSP